MNGADWTARFTKTTDSASYQVAPEERFTAGTLTLEASIRDTTGTLASTSETYAVHPTLMGLSPAAAPPGTPLAVSGQGLDAVAENNALLFPSAYGGTLRAPFATVDPATGTGAAMVPADTRTGTVLLEVNQRQSQSGPWFTLYGSFPTCGVPWYSRFMADGSRLVLYYYYYGVIGFGNYDNELADPECPRFFWGRNFRTTLLRLFPDRSVLVVADYCRYGAYDDEAILGIAVDKTGTRYAYMTEGRATAGRPYKIHTSSGFGTTLVGLGKPFVGEEASQTGGNYYYPLYLDFDAAGDIYLPAWNFPDVSVPLSLYRVPATALAAGGTVAPEVVRQYEGRGAGAVLTDMRTACDGTAWLAMGFHAGGVLLDRYVRTTSVSNASSDVDVWIDRVEGYAAGLRLAPTCRGGEVVGTTTNGLRGSDVGLFRLSGSGIEDLGSVSAPLTASGRPGSWSVWRGPIDVSPDGYAYAGPWWGWPRVPTSAPLCAPEVSSWPCPPLVVLPATTRWKPQREVTPVAVHVSSPHVLSAATVEVRDPLGTLVSATTGPLETTGPLTYKLDWTGPWQRPNPGTGELEPLPAGHYRLVVSGTRADNGLTMASNEKIVSLVEVSEVRFEALPDAPPLDDNPAVPALTEQGQDPNLGRPGGGQRIFAESTTYAGAVHNRVKVVAVISPEVAPDASLPPEATTVRVHFKSFDVDDPAPYLPDKDGDTAADAVDDNRGTPGNGVLADAFVDVPAGGTTGSTELEVSLQPGDNYRVAASTSATWLASVHAKQSVLPEPPVQDGALNVGGPNVTDMLTVWRTLHLEIDSMAAPPDEDTPPGAPEYAERNFIEGRVLRISVEGPTLDATGNLLVIEPRYVYVEPEATTPALGLGDGSLELPLHAGRFEHGRLRLGTGAAIVTVDPLDGNGTDTMTGWEYVRAITTPPEPPRIAIPFVLTSGTLRQVTGRVLAWDSATRLFTLDGAVSALYIGGTLRIAGLDWTVSGVNGAEVTVAEDQALPFVLGDDDPNATANPAFPVASVYLTDNDNPAENVFAQAYMRPRRDLVGSVTPPFIRNVWRDDAASRQAQLAAGREWQSAPAFWASYVQGASQADAKHDMDPDDEGSYLGWSEGYDDRHGLFVYVSAIDDHQFCPRSDQMDHTFAHELGHQFGLEDNSGGIMNWDTPPECVLTPNWFTTSHLASIRSRGTIP